MSKCDKCYVEIKEKKYNIISGIIETIIIQIILMIPILGFSFAKYLFVIGYKDCEKGLRLDFWNGTLYDITKKQIKVKEAKCKT